jgi:hypothetical protein
MSQPAEKDESSRGIQSKLLLVVTGVMIPLLALALPHVIEFISPKAALVYQAVGPIQIDGTKVFSLIVRNDGKAVEKNVEMWLPTKLEKSKSKLTSSIPVTTRDDGKTTVVSLGDLRPSEKVEVSVLVEDTYFFLSEYNMKGLRIVSTDQLAAWGGRSDEWDFIYRAGFWAFLLILLLAIVLGIYQEHFMSRATREKMILKEMDKLK